MQPAAIFGNTTCVERHALAQRASVSRDASFWMKATVATKRDDRIFIVCSGALLAFLFRVVDEVQSIDIVVLSLSL
jgi:hypothetical protein